MDKVLEFKELLEKFNISQTGIAKKLDIPLRTVQNWASGERKPPEYVLKLIEYRLKNELK